MTVSINVAWDEGPISFGSGTGTGTLKYIAVSDNPADDRGTVLGALSAQAPATLYGLFLDQVAVGERIGETEDGLQGQFYWDCVVTYKSATEIEPPPLTWQLDRPIRLAVRSSTQGTRPMKQSLTFLSESALTDYTFNDPNLSDEIKSYLGFVADNSEDSVSQITNEGVDVPISLVELSVETVFLDSEIASLNFLVNLSYYAGLNIVNSVAWRGFPAGSLRFTSFDANQRAAPTNDVTDNSQDWDVTYTFEYLPPVLEKDIPKPDDAFDPQLPIVDPTLGDPDGRGIWGWWLVDSLYTSKVVDLDVADPGKRLLTTPVIVRTAIQQVYYEFDFEQVLYVPNS